MIRDINIGQPPAIEESQAERIIRMRKIKDKLERRFYPPQEEIKLEDIPF